MLIDGGDAANLHGVQASPGAAHQPQRRQRQEEPMYPSGYASGTMHHTLQGCGGFGGSELSRLPHPGGVQVDEGDCEE